MEAEIISRLVDIKRRQDAASLDLRRIDDLIERGKEELEARKAELVQRQALNDNDNDNENEREEILFLDFQIKEREMDILEVQNAYVRSVEEHSIECELNLREIVECIVEEKAKELQLCAKRMEELDREQFMNALKVKYGSADLKKAEELYSLWKGYLCDPSWHPFKVVMVGDKDEVVIDENDKKLKEVKNELGGEVYEVVVKALNKFNKKNPCVRFPVSELWNSSEKRAALKDVFARLHIWWRIQRRKRPRH